MDTYDSPALGTNCPLPRESSQVISTAHGSGGLAMEQLIHKHFKRLYANPQFAACDGAALPALPGKLCLTTDSYVVDPLVFPGGDIGALAVCGTCNDLAMMGAKPRYLTVGFILEEGLALALLDQIVASLCHWAKKVGVEIVAGDTKVVERGKGDLMYINTTGMGARPDVAIDPFQIRAGDVLIVSGDIGRHGVAVMSARDGVAADVGVESDVANLSEAVEELKQRGVALRCLRDLTRGGLASALNELAQAANCNIVLKEAAIPVHDRVRAYCEILGLDPIYLACEGRFVAVVPPDNVAIAQEVLGEQARVLGEFRDTSGSLVTLRTSYGSERPISSLVGDQLPRIC